MPSLRHDGSRLWSDLGAISIRQREIKNTYSRMTTFSSDVNVDNKTFLSGAHDQRPRLHALRKTFLRVPPYLQHNYHTPPPLAPPRSPGATLIVLPRRTLTLSTPSTTHHHNQRRTTMARVPDSFGYTHHQDQRREMLFCVPPFPPVLQPTRSAPKDAGPCSALATTATTKVLCTPPRPVSFDAGLRCPFALVLPPAPPPVSKDVGVYLLVYATQPIGPRRPGPTFEDAGRFVHYAHHHDQGVVFSFLCEHAKPMSGCWLYSWHDIWEVRLTGWEVGRERKVESVITTTK
ncbi:hypothetical protein BDN72DRAFT_865098 [Pluteus cervinus]|uniref:Uncharacterized protein n=1 Tax=Pluteus cervinus TaxID=181527 RepID=A0ACD3A1L1_9AGAR|nr:hypothetical protein BDN72DRAFT_865098 [Pluteus cervinus]